MTLAMTFALVLLGALALQVIIMLPQQSAEAVDGCLNGARGAGGTIGIAINASLGRCLVLGR